REAEAPHAPQPQQLRRHRTWLDEVLEGCHSVARGPGGIGATAPRRARRGAGDAAIPTASIVESRRRDRGRRLRGAYRRLPSVAFLALGLHKRHRRWAEQAQRSAGLEPVEPRQPCRNGRRNQTPQEVAVAARLAPCVASYGRDAATPVRDQDAYPRR